MEAATFEGTERCRCCMASGAPGKDLSDQYDWMGEKEVYADMLLESFDITLSRTAGASWSICDACVARLRDSANFKKQVLHTERSLLQQLISTSIDAEIQLKVEGVKSESVGSDNDDAPEFESHFYEDDDELKDVPVKIEAGASTSNTEMSNDEDLPLSALSGTKRKAPGAKPVQVKRPKLTVKSVKTTAKTTVKATAKAKVATKPVANANAKVALAASKVAAANKLSAQSLLSKLSARPIKITVKSSKPGVAKKGSPGSKEKVPASADANHFSIAVLNHSNATPFERRRGKTFCCIFNCYEHFDVPALRDHTRSDHIAHIFRAAKGEPKTALRVDITDLQCTICDLKTPDLETLERHLNDIHRISTYRNTADVLIPYKLAGEGYQCQLCDEKCEEFPAIDEHMESHFPLNICEVCGRGFMSVRRLKKHSLEHAEKSFACETCDARFLSGYLKKRHVSYVHEGVGFSICAKCPGLRFKDHRYKLDHMERVHGQKKRPTSACERCGKVFSCQSALASHVRTIHQALRPNKCGLCDEGFGQKKDLEAHVRSAHTGERLPCVYCDRRYLTVKLLARHMNLSHPTEVRHCLCYVCGKPHENLVTLKKHKLEEHKC